MKMKYLSSILALLLLISAIGCAAPTATPSPVPKLKRLLGATES